MVQPTHVRGGVEDISHRPTRRAVRPAHKFFTNSLPRPDTSVRVLCESAFMTARPGRHQCRPAPGRQSRLLLQENDVLREKALELQQNGSWSKRAARKCNIKTIRTKNKNAEGTGALPGCKPGSAPQFARRGPGQLLQCRIHAAENRFSRPSPMRAPVPALAFLRFAFRLSRVIS